MHTMVCDGHSERVNLYAMVKFQAQALRLLELPSGRWLYGLALVLGIGSSVVMRITQFTSLFMLVSLHLAARVPSQVNSGTGYPLVPYGCQSSLVQRPRAAGIQQGLAIRLGHMVHESLEVTLGVWPPEESGSFGLLETTLRALGIRLPEQSRVVQEITPLNVVVKERIQAIWLGGTAVSGRNLKECLQKPSQTRSLLVAIVATIIPPVRQTTLFVAGDTPGRSESNLRRLHQCLQLIPVVWRSLTPLC